MIAIALKPEDAGYHGLSWGKVGNASVYASLRIVSRCDDGDRFDCFATLGQKSAPDDWEDPRLPGRPVLEFKTSAASVDEAIVNTRDWLERKLGQRVNVMVALSGQMEK